MVAINNNNSNKSQIMMREKFMCVRSFENQKMSFPAEPTSNEFAREVFLSVSSLMSRD
jgi:hypothetical protein